METAKIQDVTIHMSEPRLWIAMLLTILFFLFFNIWMRKQSTLKQNIALKVLGIIILSLIVVQHPILALSDDLEWSVHKALPLHLCALSFLFTGINCFLRKPLIWTFLLFTGIIGGVHSFLTPQLPQGDSPFFYFVYYFKHGAILFLPILAWQLGEFKLKRYTWLRMFALLNILAFVMFLIDYSLNSWYPGKYIANYMYVWEPPKANSPLILGGWPWYLIPFISFALLHFLVIHLIFRFAQRREKIDEEDAIIFT